MPLQFALCFSFVSGFHPAARPLQRDGWLNLSIIFTGA